MRRAPRENLEVLKGYHASTTTAFSKLDFAQQTALQEIEELIQAELTPSDQSVLLGFQSELGYTQAQRKANLGWMKALDNMLRAGCGMTLADFAPKRRLASLGDYQRREFVASNFPYETADRRSVIASADGSRQNELPKVIIAGERGHRTLHLACDQGSTGLPAVCWLLLGKGLRATALGLVPPVAQRLARVVAGERIDFAPLGVHPCPAHETGPMGWRRQLALAPVGG